MDVTNRRTRRYVFLILSVVSCYQLFVYFKHLKTMGTYGKGPLDTYYDRKPKVNQTIKIETDINAPKINFWEVWKLLDDMISNNGLYPETFNFTIATDALKYAKVEFADEMFVRSSKKWILTVEGGQKVLFKPQTVNKSLEYKHCNMGCEKPEKEVAGFTTSRMLGFLNFPFVVGRKLNIVTEILPVASGNLKMRLNITKDGDVCLQPFFCLRTYRKTKVCYKKGIVPGAMIYFIRKKVRQIYDENRRDKHPYYPILEAIERPREYMLYGIGDDRYCRIFRQLPDYNTNAMFAYILDFTVLSYITNHRDQKPARVANDTTSLPVVFDFGLAFCTTFLQSYIVAAPIYQCCKIRRQTYERLIQLKDTFTNKFQEMTHTDVLYPLLLPEQFDEIHTRIGILLKFVDRCIQLKGYHYVVTDEFEIG